MAQQQVGTATTQQNFLRRQHNSYGAYGICVTAMAERQWKLKTRHNPNPIVRWIVKCDRVL